jgi:hypothetical protein
MKVTLSLLKISTLLLFVESLHGWIFWELNFAITIFCAITSIFVATKFPAKFFVVSTNNVIQLTIFIIIQLYISQNLNLNGILFSIIRAIPIIVILLIDNEIKSGLFVFLTKTFAFVLFISLSLWILMLFRVSLPYSTLVFNNGQYIFQNYYFFLLNEIDLSMPFPRFTSIFLEPGQLGMITSFFLCGNQFKLKNPYVLIIFIATIFTFSLAAYLLLIISATSFLTLYSKNPIRNFLFWCFFIFGLYNLFLEYNGGNNIFNKLILQRLESDNGKIAGDNRTTKEMDLYYVKFLSSDEVNTGIGVERYLKLFLGANAGYKVFIILYGFIGTSLVFLFYLMTVIDKPTKMAWILFLVYTLCFLQAAYPLWECELLLFITALAYFKQKSEKGAIY